MGFLISETTREEREKIVADSLGFSDINCDGCMARVVDMYQDYIDGKKELKDITMGYSTNFVKDEDMDAEGRTTCCRQ